MSVKVSGRNAENLAGELIAKITETGFGAMSKTDLYDFLLYLLDEHCDDGHFLRTQSNFENALLLKVPESKVKNSKLNIDLKFRLADRDKTIADFLSSLDATRLKSNKERDSYVFVLDDAYTRMCIESVLKKSGDTLDYRINSEKVEVGRATLRDFLGAYQKELGEELQKSGREEFFKDVVRDLTKKFVPSDALAKALVEAAEKAARKLTSKK